MAKPKRASQKNSDDAIAGRKLTTWSSVFSGLNSKSASSFNYSNIIIDEAQDISVSELKFVARLVGDKTDGLFFAGDLGQRIFRQPFSWKSLGVDVRGRSNTLKINYRTSHQIRQQADRLLPKEISDLDENEVTLFGTAKGPVCVRGLGDKFTSRYSYVEYPVECKSIPKLTITHDPAGAFDRRIKGLVIAGHTHCGQVSLPFIGPLWVPTDAPSFAQCGLHEGGNVTVFVTSGVGTSILPLRFGAQSQWDYLRIKISNGT